MDSVLLGHHRTPQLLRSLRQRSPSMVQISVTREQRRVTAEL